MEPLTRRAPRALVRRQSRSARETTGFGLRIGRMLAPGDVVALVGELGAGKTELARGICRGAGVAPADVASPSFAVVASYRGRLPVHHADLYRVADFDELYATGFTDLLGAEGALVVEWADRIPDALPAERLEVRLAHDARRPSLRHILVVGTGARHAALARALGTRRPATRRQPRKVSGSGRSRR